MNHAGFKVCHLAHDGNPQVIDLPGAAEIRLDGPFFAALVAGLPVLVVPAERLVWCVAHNVPGG